MRSEEARQIFKRRQLLEVICQLRFPDILKIESTDPAEFQDRIRGEYPQYQKKVEQLPPQIVNGKPVPQGTVNNYQFISEDSQWKVSLTKGFVALSTHGYLRWEEFAKRLDRALAALIQLYQPAYFTRVGLRYINAIDRAALGLEDAQPHAECRRRPRLCRHRRSEDHDPHRAHGGEACGRRLRQRPAAHAG